MKRFVPMIAVLLCAAQAAELPVREVILFKHGVGFFSRSGELKAGDTARLDFKAGDMNDVLKSLTVEEKGGGKVIGLRYDSSEPLAKKLEQFPFAIGDHFAMSAVFDQMRGARIELKYGNDPITGAVVSGRETFSSDKDRPGKEQLVLLLDSGEMRTIDLGAATGIRFLDPVVQRQFADYLRVVSLARSKEKRSVYLDSTSAAARSLVANYMIPSAIWKSSYRLVLGSLASTLEGWAIVDNTTDEDWSNIRLSLVSGRPISFISQLYEPRYRERPTVQLAEEEAVAPVVYDGVMESFDRVSRFANIQKAPPVGAAAGSGSGGGVERSVYRMLAPNPADGRRLVKDSTVAVATEGSERGELFEYRFDVPVTVKKSESAMLPFLQQKVASRKLLIYQEWLGEQYPRTAVEISNATGKTLDGGPVTVYDDGVYAGEALFETLKAGDKRLIGYAVDLGTRVSTKLESSEERRRATTAQFGVLHSRLSVEASKTYTIRNVDPRAKTLIIEHPIREGFRLVNQKPFETTANVYRFEVKLDAKAATAFVVKEESIYEETYSVSTLTPDVMSSFVSHWPLSDSAKRRLTAIADRKKQIVEIDGQLKETESEIGDLTRDQEGLRKNITTLQAISGQQEQVQRYSKQLGEGETRLGGLRDRQREARKRKQAVEGEVQGLIDKLEF
jgi:hypothetical protein